MLIDDLLRLFLLMCFCRGDSAFCSLECRQQQMNQDERKQKCTSHGHASASASASAAKKQAAAAASSTAARSQVSSKGERDTVAAAV